MELHDDACPCPAERAGWADAGERDDQIEDR
jgi:hypothetical protein